MAIPITSVIANYGQLMEEVVNDDSVDPEVQELAREELKRWKRKEARNGKT